MELDTRTLMVASVVNAILLGALAFNLAGRSSKADSIRQWAGAMLVLALGLGSLALRGALPALVTIALANTVIVAAIALATRSLRRFGGIAEPDRLSWVIVVTLFALNLAFARPETDYRSRIVAMSIGMALLFARGALALRHGTPPHARRSFRFTEIVMWLCSGITAARGVLVMFERSLDVMEPTPLHASVFLFYAGFVTASTLGVIWMANEDLQGELAHSAAFDPLTQVLNRGAFLTQFEREVSRSKREETVFSLAIFDLDRFKRINDEFGHPTGDRVLQSVVATLNAGLRKHDIVGRYGGEEFSLLMPNTAKDTAMLVAERMRAEIERRGFDLADRHISITVSGGVATYPHDGEDWDALLTAADNALYDAKQGGRNRIVAAWAHSQRPASG